MESSLFWQSKPIGEFNCEGMWILFCFTDDKNALKLKDKYYNIDEGSNANKELQSDLIKESNSGVLVKNSDDLKDVLVDLISEFNQTRSIKCESEKVDRFSREFRVKELADLIRKTISSWLMFQFSTTIWGIFYL